MANNLTNYGENVVLNHLMNKVDYTPSANVYVALFTADPTEAGLLTSEVTGGAYARATYGPAELWEATAGVIGNQSVINFATATADWGTITHVGIMPSTGGSNMLLFVPLTTAVGIVTNNRLAVAVSNLNFEAF